MVKTVMKGNVPLDEHVPAEYQKVRVRARLLLRGPPLICLWADYRSTTCLRRATHTGLPR